jgi:hemoglobin-like flavoprotein
MTALIKVILFVSSVMKDIWIMMNCIAIYAKNISSVISVTLRDLESFISKYRSLQVYQQSYSQVGHRVLSDFTLKIVQQNPPRSE